MNKMLTYWQTQPGILRSVFENRKSLTVPFVEAFERTKPDRLYIVGSGTSGNAATAAAPYMQKVLGIEVTVITPSVIPPIYAKRPLMVYLSQGGSSTNTLAAMEQLGQYPFVTLTGEQNCEIVKRGEHHMLIGCGQELVGPKTVGYTASVLSLYACALEAAAAVGGIPAEAYQTAVAALQQAIGDMRQNIETARAWLDEREAQFANVHKYVLVGNGVAAPCAAEGALKLQETIKAPAIAFEMEEYLHGPILMTDEGLCGLFSISGDAQQLQRITQLFYTHADYSPYAYAVAGEGALSGKNVLNLKLGDREETHVFAFILLPQLLSARMPLAMGIGEG
ncbi:MAG: hypothetical protein LBU67_00025, partial [Oscillospiraceae bacterium]|nr:hypothetical protein [Oscillospiraceae bacterium]